MDRRTDILMIVLWYVDAVVNRAGSSTAATEHCTGAGGS